MTLTWITLELAKLSLYLNHFAWFVSLLLLSLSCVLAIRVSDVRLKSHPQISYLLIPRILLIMSFKSECDFFVLVLFNLLHRSVVYHSLSGGSRNKARLV